MAETERPRQPVFDHVGISVTDLARSEAFYCNVLGADVIFPRHDAGWGERTIITLGHHAIDLNQFAENDGARFDPIHTGLDHLAFAADSLDELASWASWLDANGVARSPIRDVRADPRQAPDAPIAGAMFDFLDPDGIQLEFLFFSGTPGDG